MYTKIKSEFSLNFLPKKFLLVYSNDYEMLNNSISLHL